MGKWILAIGLVVGLGTAAAQRGGMTILDARYGIGERSCDVTAEIGRACDGRSSCTFEVSNRLCSDPARNERKALGVVFRCGRGGDGLQAFPEGVRATLSCSSVGSGFRPPNAGHDRGLQIEYVRYGIGDRTCDATPAFARRCNGQSRCEVEVNNRLCGDPARNQRKYAEIQYRCNGRPMSGRVDEGRYANLRCQ